MLFDFLLNFQLTQHVTFVFSDDDLTKSNIGYNTGYVACSKEISRFLSSVCDIPDDIKAKMINHLLKQSSPSRERIPEDTIKTEKVEIKDSSYSQSESPPIVSSTSDSSMEPLKVQCGDGVIIVVQLSKAERTIEAVHLVDTNMKPNTSLATPLLIHAQPIWHATDQGLLTIASVRPQSNDYCPSLAADSANASLMAPVSTQSGVIDLAESSNAQCVNSLPCCDGAVWRPW